MRVIIQVSSGPAAGKRILLGAGHSVTIGRTEWADHAFPQDGRMSGTHFALETDSAACYVRDMGSTNGTFVGGRRIADRAALRHGDEILAGETRFQVQIEGAPGEGTPIDGASPGAAPFDAGQFGAAPVAAGPFPGILPEFAPPPFAPPALAAPMPVAPMPVAPMPAGPQPAGAAFTVEKCDSGLTLCRGLGEQIAPADLAVLLCQSCPAYLIVDFHKLGSPPPPDLAMRHYLFDWLPEPSAEVVSPLVVGQDDLLTWPVLVGEGWGKDAVICLFSRQDKAALTEHLHRSLRAKPQRDDMSGGMLGYCWPSVMAMLLGHSPPSMARPLLAGIDAVLVELPDLPETWQLFGEAGVVNLLTQAGLRRRTEEVAHA